MSQFKGRRGDLTWGKYEYPVTRTQKETLDELRYLMTGLPHVGIPNENLPKGYFCSQRPDNGEVVIGLHGYSVSVRRNGRLLNRSDRIRASHA